MVSERLGDWMQVASGAAFYPFDPRPEEIRIEDIAAALSKQCRFAGHCLEFYSVAEHCVRVSEICEPEDALWGLLHDAPEAYLVDLPRPIKRHVMMEQYSRAEQRVMEAVAHRFGLPQLWFDVEMPASVKLADEILLATEARDLMGNAALERWSSLKDVQPLSEIIQPWPWEVAEQRFLARFAELTR